MSAALTNSPRMMCVFERISKERLRQRRLLAEGRISFNVASPVVNHDMRLRVATEELGEVAQAIDRLSDPNAGSKAREHLRDELVQLAAVTTAWLESMEVVP